VRRLGASENPLAHRVEHLEEHGFDVQEIAPEGDPRPEAMAVVQLDGATATIYAYASESDAVRAAKAFAAEEQTAPDRVRVQREGENVYVGRAPVGGKLPSVSFEDAVTTAEEEH
jgi:hypothetical protein